MRLVLIHGRDQAGRNQEKLKQSWLDALDIGLDRANLPKIKELEVVFPFYGNELAAMCDEISCKHAEFLAKGVPKNIQVTGRLQAEILAEMLATVAPPPAGVVAGGCLSKGLQNNALALALARAVDASWFAPDILAQITQDVDFYLSYPAISERINDQVCAAIGTDPCVVVAHSLGSVVAYRCLRALDRVAQVRLLVTLGSPLGLSAIRRHLTPPALAFPLGVHAWLNARDARDIVALYELDSSAWDVEPPIENTSSIDNHQENRHGISGYLDDPTVARRIYEALKLNDDDRLHESKA